MKKLFVIVIVMVVLSLSGTVLAAKNNYIGPVNGSWENNNNWSLGHAPLIDPNDDVVINKDAIYPNVSVIAEELFIDVNSITSGIDNLVTVNFLNCDINIKGSLTSAIETLSAGIINLEGSRLTAGGYFPGEGDSVIQPRSYGSQLSTITIKGEIGDNISDTNNEIQFLSYQTGCNFVWEGDHYTEVLGLSDHIYTFPGDTIIIRYVPEMDVTVASVGENPLIADFNYDLRVNLIDFSVFNSEWLENLSGVPEEMEIMSAPGGGEEGVSSVPEESAPVQETGVVEVVETDASDIVDTPVPTPTYEEEWAGYSNLLTTVINIGIESFGLDQVSELILSIWMTTTGEIEQ